MLTEMVGLWDLDVRDVCESLGVHQATVGRWARQGVLLPDGNRIQLAARRFGGKWRTNARAVAEFIQNMTSFKQNDGHPTEPLAVA
jgi:predicted site-specific integrase-resolvase